MIRHARTRTTHASAPPSPAKEPEWDMDHFANLVNHHVAWYNETTNQFNDLDTLCDEMCEETCCIEGAPYDEAIDILKQVAKQFPIMCKSHKQLERQIHELRKGVKDLHDAQCFRLIYRSSRDAVEQLIRSSHTLNERITSVGEYIEHLKKALNSLYVVEPD